MCYIVLRSEGWSYEVLCCQLMMLRFNLLLYEYDIPRCYFVLLFNLFYEVSCYGILLRGIVLRYISYRGILV